MLFPFVFAVGLNETRSVGGLFLGATTNSLPLTDPPTTFARSASALGTNAIIIPPAASTFTFGKTDRGKVERVDLLVDLAIDPNVDSDGDGVPNWAELVAGTDPNDPNSVFKMTSSIVPNAQGGLTISWSSVPGRTYAVRRSEDLGIVFTTFAYCPASTNTTTTSYTDHSAVGPGPYFYCIRVEP